MAEAGDTPGSTATGLGSGKPHCEKPRSTPRQRRDTGIHAKGHVGTRWGGQGCRRQLPQDRGCRVPRGLPGMQRRQG